MKEISFSTQPVSFDRGSNHNADCAAPDKNEGGIAPALKAHQQN
jgi:hypothetical protein